ncbi:MAG: sigma-70 family RNA polymerase sigma factor [Planctomycetes bacterium]|nr:sigma-70 family RNA polymerase sigma factor [Planctomycetota bacterium]
MAANLLEAVKAPEARSRLSTARPPSDATIRSLDSADQVLLTKLLTEPVDYVDHPDFADDGIARRLFGGEARLEHRLSTRFRELPDGVSDSVAAGERLPALSAEAEALLFMRFNFARKHVAEILDRHSGKPLSASATRVLLAWGHRVLAARSVIVRLNMPLVLAMAKRTRLSGIDFNDMISEGNMALLRSVEKFDCARGYKFSTYSCRAILKSFSRVAMRASRYRGKFPAEFDPAMERSDFIERRRDGLERDCVDELKDILIQNLAGLSDVERKVIDERFALSDYTGQAMAPKTLEQVGHLIGVTKERVRQIQNNALRKIRSALEENFLAA